MVALPRLSSACSIGRSTCLTRGDLVCKEQRRVLIGAEDINMYHHKVLIGWAPFGYEPSRGSRNTRFARLMIGIQPLLMTMPVPAPSSLTGLPPPPTPAARRRRPRMRPDAARTPLWTRQRQRRRARTSPWPSAGRVRPSIQPPSIRLSIHPPDRPTPTVWRWSMIVLSSTPPPPSGMWIW